MSIFSVFQSLRSGACGHLAACSLLLLASAGCEEPSESPQPRPTATDPSPEPPPPPERVGPSSFKPPHRGEVRTISWLPERRLMTTASDDMRIWDADAGELVRRLPGEKRRWSLVAVGPNGRIAVSPTMQGKLRYWDMKREQTVWFLNGLRREATAVAYGAGFVAGGGVFGDVVVWVGSTSQPSLESHPHEGEVLAVAIDESDLLVVSYALDQQICRAPLRGGVSTCSSTKGETASLAVAAAKRVITSSEGGVVQVFDSTTGELMREWKPHERGVSALAYSEAHGLVFTGGPLELAVWDVASGERVAHEQTHHIPRAAAFGLEAGEVAFGDNAGKVYVWDFSTPEVGEPAP